MYAFKHRPAASFVEQRPRHLVDAAARRGGAHAAPSPARAMQAQLADAFAVDAAERRGLSGRARLAIVVGLAAACWAPAIAATVLLG